MVIAVDVGGTNLRAGRLDQDKIIVQKAIPLRDKEVLQKTIDQLVGLIRSVMDKDITGIGIGVPSVVDLENGIVTDVTNIASWKRVELKRILEEEFKIPVRVNNDVNCFILGEHRHGVVKGFKTVVGLAMGTGLGGGVIINNELYAGKNCGAGEFGLVPYLDDCIENYCSSWFFHNKYNTTALTAFQKAGEGDDEALKSWKEFGVHLGNAIKTVMYTYDPEAIVLGGSLSNGYKYFKDSMHEVMNTLAFPESVKKLKLFVSDNPNIALLGAASLIQ
ncbi:MAG TPA: ROK family protein [Bacteroidales bacterium]|nr:ROK family protein [Bacteroidales bacterium]